MKLHDALRKTIRHYGTSVIEDKRLMSFLADYRAFDDFPAMKDVMRCIATGDYGKKLCLAADGSDDDFLRFASEHKEALVREKSFKEEFADYAIESISFALGIPCAAAVTEPGDHGFEAVQKNNGSQKNTVYQVSNGLHVNQVPPQASAPRQASRQTAFVISGNTWQTASDGAESHRRFYRGHDLTAAFDSGEFSRNVADGSFRDIFPGDYIIRKIKMPAVANTQHQFSRNVAYGSFMDIFLALRKITVPAAANTQPQTYKIKFVVADLGDAIKLYGARVAVHHAVIVPSKPIFRCQMDFRDDTSRGYARSYMGSTVLPAFAKELESAFGQSHILTFDADRKSYACRLMTLQMVFGNTLPSSGLSYSDYAQKDKCLGGEQLAAFRINQQLMNRNNSWYWLSDICSTTDFAEVTTFGSWSHAQSGRASCMGGVRPFALLV